MSSQHTPDSHGRDAVLARAMEAQQTGRLEEARRGYGKHLKKWPKDSDALYLLGVVEMQLGRPDHGVELIGRAIKLDESKPHFHAHLGIALLKAGRSAEAVSACQRALALKPDYFVAFCALVDSVAHLTRAGASVAAISRAREESPRSRLSKYPSFSVIICSVEQEKGIRIRKHYETLLAGYPFEIIIIPDAQSLCEGYNRGFAKSSGDILIFSHDDIEVLSPDFAARLLVHLANHDVVGVAGTSKLIGTTWTAADWPHNHGLVALQPSGQAKVRFDVYGPLPGSTPIQALDGILIATTRKVCEATPFDQATFDGFHFYDLDFTFRAFSAGFRLTVSDDILVLHYSAGNYDSVWVGYAQKFAAKHAGRVSFKKEESLSMAQAQFATKQEAIAFHQNLLRAQDSQDKNGTGPLPPETVSSPRPAIVREASERRDSAFDWTGPLLELPPVLPVSAWTGHIPFLFLLFRLARPRTFVELGVHLGTSFIAGCEAARRFETETRCWGVDTWQGDAHTGAYEGDAIYKQLRAFVAERYRHCVLVRSTFDDAAAGFEPGTIDLLHIDGLHTYEAVAHDFATWLPKLSARSIVLFHDTEVRERDFGVWKFWEEMKTRYRSLEFHHSSGLGVLMVGESIATEFDRFLRQFEGELNRFEQFRAACESAGATLPSRMQRRASASLPKTAAATRDPREPSSWGKVGRNEPCPCGSGKKFKNCHGRLA